jgi:predicted esterase
MSSFDLQTRLFKLFDEGKYQEALDVANVIEETYPDMIHKTYFWRACLYCALEETSQAMLELNSGLNQGVWWNPNTLMNDADLKPLHDIDEFRDILKQCESILKEASSLAKPEHLILKPEANMQERIPVLYSLHWRGDNINSFSQYWDIEELREDYIFAFPQSSQIYGFNAFCWDNTEIAKEEIMTTLKKIKKEIDIENNDVILAGASQGGKLALELALNNEISNVKGFIIVVPSIREITGYEGLIEKATEKGMKGYIITGDKDYFYSDVLKLQTLFEEKNFPCKLYIKEGMGHFFPQDFSTILVEAIECFRRLNILTPIKIIFF